MPIKPERKGLYPRNWPEIVAQVRIRSGNRCEECGAANGAPNPVTGSKVVLTTAHLNHDETDCSLGNLLHLCQLHHNRLDVAHRAESRRLTREKKTGQERLT